jgi:tricorn protease
MRKLASVSLCLLFAVGCFAQSGSSVQLLRQPSIGQNLVAFEYGNEIWVAPRAGGDARLLTTGPGVKSWPYISPDGKWIAYTGNYDGNFDVYVVPANGGEARRLTHHPGPDVAAGWSADSKSVLFISARNSSTPRYNRLFTVSISGGLPYEVPLPTAEGGSLSPDDSHIAYIPVTNWSPRVAWKRYRGGKASRIWIADLKDSSTAEIPRTDSQDKAPMWVGSKVYFLSDRAGSTTLFSYDTKSKKVDQLLPANGADIINASATSDAIILERMGALQIYDLNTKKLSDLKIRVAGDLPSLRSHFVKASDQIDAYGISPTGARAVFEAHGEILTVPAEKGDIRNLTNSPGVADRDPAWSPDGKQIAYFSDESGEYQLHIKNQDGMGEVKKVSLSDSPSFFYDPKWSADGKKILYTDKHLNLWYIDVAGGKPVKVDTDYFESRTMEPSWAPDSKWIIYAKQTPAHLRALWVYSLENGQKTQVTDGMSDASSPQFDKSGKYLFFLASTDIGPLQGGIDLSILSHQFTNSAYVMVLRKDLPSPLAPESDEEGSAEKKDGDTPPGMPPTAAAAATAGQDKPEAKPDAAKAGGDSAKADAAKADAAKAPKVPAVRIDFDGIDQRILALPVPTHTYATLVAGIPGSIFLEEVPTDLFSPIRTATITRFDLTSRRATKLLEGVTAFTLSANGKKMLYRQGVGPARRWLMANVPPTPPPGAPAPPPGAPTPPVTGEPLRVEAMQVMVDPQQEWQQMYREVWRVERDYFYDPNLHGVNWKAYERAYEPYVKAVSSREDLEYVFHDMLGEITVGHMYITAPPQAPNPDQPQGGLLGADYHIENGRYRFSKVYQGENWNPQLRAPLTEPGVNVKTGEYLLAVNGRELKGTDEIFELFQGTAGKQTVLKVSSDAEGKNARTVTAVPVTFLNELNLRNRAWIDANRHKVDELSGGRLAYVYLPDTAQGGYTYFNRYYFAQLGREGAVIDERFNGGGLAADYIIDYLRRPVMNYWLNRDGGPSSTPQNVIPGPKAMIINMYAGSGGDAMPWYFRFHHIGPLVGTRTWGGLVGIGGFPRLIDGGGITAPNFAFFNTKGEWDVENHGVAPDVEVEYSPKAWRQGHDPQLEKAVQLVMDELKKTPVKSAQKPAYPNYHPGQNDQVPVEAGKSQQEENRLE